MLSGDVVRIIPFLFFIKIKIIKEGICAKSLHYELMFMIMSQR